MKRNCTNKFRLIKLTAIFFLFFFSQVNAQTKIIKGFVKDGHSDELLPFASVQFKNTGIGKTTDSSGAFKFVLSKWPSDTLVITSISYKAYYFIIPKNKDTIDLSASLEAGNAIPEVVVRAKLKHSRGWYLWKKVVAHRDENNIFKFDNFTYNVYNRLEIDINNINKEKIKKNLLLRKFDFISNSIDTTSEEKPILPSFFSETLSDYYYQKKPHKTREIIRANQITGVKNQSITKYLGGLYQNIVIYQNFIPVFDKEFVSPINDNGDAYYDYRLADTQYVAGRRLLHLVFIPRHKGQNTFTGDCWINDTTFAVQKVILHINKEANINFVDKLSIVQEFSLINDSTWFLSKDKFIVNINPIGNKALGFIARKTTNYNHVLVNVPEVANEVSKNKVIEEVVVLPNTKEKPSQYWDSSRIEPLSKSENGIYVLVDSLTHSPRYKRTYNTIYFLSTGYKNIGKIQIGPWFSWISANALEGTRLRFDLGTNKNFSKKIYLHGYLAYGFTDKRFKGQAEALWLLKRNPWQTIHASYINDLSFSQNYNRGDISGDNVLAVAIRKNGIPIKFINLEEKKIEYSRDSKVGLSTIISIANKIYTPLRNIPGKDFFPVNNGHPLNSTEISLKLRFAYIEKLFETNFFRYSLGSTYPIAELTYTQGIKGILNSDYTYEKIAASISDDISIAPFGKLSYNLYGGKVFNKLPYVFLEVHPGNEVYYYNKYAFNLMNKYEFVSDRYAGISIEHNIGNGLFKYIPLTRKFKFRQFWNVKAIAGNLSDANKTLNSVSSYPIKSLDGKIYMEVGTGVDNIFKLFRLDFVWRLLPTPLPANRASRFGIFGSFHVQL
ncbi:MAG: DUF5686 family protein [Ferruginibacter sp.]